MVESKESHWDSSPRFDLRLWSHLTNRFCSCRLCHRGSEVGHWIRSVTPHVHWSQQLLNVQRAVTSYSNWTWRHNWVTAPHYSFVNVIQGYEVEALHTPTFRLSPLLINQLDLGRHITIFRNGKCSIISPSSCTLAGKQINGIYIIVSAITLFLTTENRKMRMRDNSKVIIAEATINPIIAEPSIELTIKSSRAGIAAKTKSLTISESRLWHRWLAHMNPTTIESLVSGYTHDDSMCTICIQGKHK